MRSAAIARAYCHCSIFSLLALIGWGLGCSQPKGVLFLPIDPPHVWPSPPDTPRIRLVGVIRDSRDLKASKSGFEVVKELLRGPLPPIGFLGPHGMAVSEDRLLAVADGAGACVHIVDLLDRSHTQVSGWSKVERFHTPVGVAWVRNRLYVTDAGRGEVIVLDSSGAFVTRWGKSYFQRPVGIAATPSPERLLIVDGGAHRLYLTTTEGMLIRGIGQRGSGPGEFNFPSHVAVRGEVLAVADSGNFRVQILDLRGQCLSTIGQKGDGAGDFALPKGIAMDGRGNLYVVDAQFENVQIFNGDGQLLLAFGEEGEGLGQFSLPSGIVIDGKNWIWVADSGNRRIQVFALLEGA